MNASRLLAAAVLVGCCRPAWAAPPEPEDGVYVLTAPERTAEQVDATYAGMPALAYKPPPDRWKDLPRTAGIFRKGGDFRAVMLGDSIVNDTSRSGWEYAVGRAHPGVRVTKITCVRGGTGCWWYKEPGRVKKYVLDLKPDLLVIGGISQREDTDSIRDVVRQVRAAGPCDVLLMTPAFGSVDPRADAQWQSDFDPKGGTYRARLFRLAAEEGCGFLDMTAAWGAYIRGTDKDLDYFKRDNVHANERGEQILGRALAAYLGPDRRP